MRSGGDLMTYPGGKNGAGVFQTIINRMPPHRVYIEPFVGGAAILRLKRPAELSIAADLDRDVILGLAWTLSRADNPARPCSLAEICHLARIRGARVPPDPARGAANQTGSTEDQQAVTPIRAHRHNRRADPLARNGEQVRLLAGDGIELLERYPFAGDELVYCDPPYVHSTRSRRRLYEYEMTDVDHRRLLRVLRKLPCRVMISGYWSLLYGEALQGWESLTFQTTNRAGQKTREWLWSNFPEPVELHDYRYLGKNFREREKLNRRRRRWKGRLERMTILERRALLAAIDEAWNSPEQKPVKGDTDQNGQAGHDAAPRERGEQPEKIGDDQ